MRQKLQLRTNAWIRFRFILLATLLFSSFQSYAELGQTDLDEIKKSPFFKNRYTKGMVWDCSRKPSNAEAGVEWELSEFKAPYDASNVGVPIDFGRNSDRYVQFDIENILDPTYSYITDDSGNKLVISLRLYEADGTIVSTVSEYGTMQGLGKDAPGFFYAQENSLGTLFTMDMKEYTIEDKVTYIPETGVVKELSELGLVSDNDNGNGPIEDKDDKVLIIETTNKYKEGENGTIKNFDGTINESEIKILTIGGANSPDALPINILIKGTTVSESTTVTSNTTATLTLSGATDLGPVENKGILTLEKDETDEIPLTLGAEITNNRTFTDNTGLLTEVKGDASITIAQETIKMMNKEFTIEKGGEVEVVASTVSGATLSYIWEKLDEKSVRGALSLRNTDGSSNGKKTFNESGQYRCLVKSENSGIVSILTVYVTITVTTPTPPPYIPTYYSVYLPEVEGADLSLGSGSFVVEEGYDFSFTLTLKPGYEQSTPLVKANGNVLELNAYGLYTVSYIYADQTVTIDGVVKDTIPTPPTAIDKLDGMIVKVWDTNGILYVYTPQATDIQIINLSGKLIRQKGKACGENHFDLPKGTYIVVVGRETFKIVL